MVTFGQVKLQSKESKGEETRNREDSKKLLVKVRGSVERPFYVMHSLLPRYEYFTLETVCVLPLLLNLCLCHAEISKWFCKKTFSDM